MHAAMEMEDSMHSRTSKRGFFSLSCCSLHNLLSESCAKLLRVSCVGVRVFTHRCTQPCTHSSSEPRASLLLDLIHSTQGSHPGCKSFPSQC